MFSERRDNEVRIDLSPLIDVVFLLLIFFMVTTTFNEQQAVEIELPSAQGEAQRADRDLPEVAMDSEGVLRLDGETIAVEALAARLRERFGDRAAAERIVIVRGDRAATWDLGLKVMEQLRQADVVAASALTEPRPAEEEAP